MSCGTVGRAGQVFDGPTCYIESWDMAFQKELRHIAKLGSLAKRRHALKSIEARSGKAGRQRMEAALTRLWLQRGMK